MGIYINSKTKSGAYGGGNQFLKALRVELKNQNFYTEGLNGAGAVIFNHYQDLVDLVVVFLTKPKIKIVHRLGPVMSLHRTGFKWKIVDYLVIFCANFFADLVIFQSEWSYKEALKLGFRKNKKYKIIHNAVDGNIFYKKENKERNQIKPIELIYTSWSKNMKKGFFYLSFLDENLDFNKYNMKFVGNSPLTFKNIKVVSPIKSDDLAEELRNSDIFISPTKDDACSNAILEALVCGLPTVALNSGANVEIIGDGGLVFNNEEDMIRAIEEMGKNLSKYQKHIKVKSIEEVARDYVLAIESI